VARAVHVDLVVKVRVLRPHRKQRSQVIHLVHTVHGFGQRLRVQQVPFDELHLHAGQRGAVLPGHDHYAHIVALFQAKPRDVVADKPGCAGDQNFAHGVFSFPDGGVQ
jgi:hypothetical protein